MRTLVYIFVLIVFEGTSRIVVIVFFLSIRVVMVLVVVTVVISVVVGFVDVVGVVGVVGVVEVGGGGCGVRVEIAVVAV